MKDSLGYVLRLMLEERTMSKDLYERKISSLSRYTSLARPYGKSQHGSLVNKEVLIAKNSNLFRRVGLLDWAWYTPKGLGDALNEGTVADYYTTMLRDERSPPNKWRDKYKETDLKSSYSARSGITEWVMKGDSI